MAQTVEYRYHGSRTVHIGGVLGSSFTITRGTDFVTSTAVFREHSMIPNRLNNGSANEFQVTDSMHFWIDKRSQTCGFSGRHRVPSSLGGSGRRWRGTKPMVTPVHRFQPIECVTGQYAHSHLRRPNRHACLPQPTYRLEGVTTELPVRAHAVELDSSVFLDLPLDGSTEDQTHVVLPDLEPVGKLKCGMWTSFALATVLIIGAKFYFNNQETALEVLIFAALMIVFLLAGCTISMCRSKATRDLLSAAVTSSAPYGPSHPPSLPTLQPQPEELPPPAQPLTEPPPPPYHIAILLPQQINAEEVPPPSYDKAVS